MKGKASRRLFAVALFGAATFVCALPADAASRICRQLQAELQHAGSGGKAKPRLLVKYDDAIDRQRGEIDKARRQARRAGCGFLLFGGNVSRCAGLNAAIDRMGGNLDKLVAKRASLATGGSRRDRRRILEKLDANGCNGAPPAKARPAVGDQTRVDISDDSDNSERISRVLNQQPGMPIRIPPPPQGTGEYRTMCVRTCDGYFFPMSNAATVGDFERDQKNCESSCPGTEMQVFYSRGIGGDSADMTSAADGRPYRDLPTAYVYKRADVSLPQCGCKAAGGYSVIGDTAAPNRAPQEGKAVSSSIVAFPVPTAPKPKATPVEATGNEPEIKAIPLSEEKRNVRVVGPKFLPDPKGAIDLRDLDRTEAR